MLVNACLFSKKNTVMSSWKILEKPQFKNKREKEIPEYCLKTKGKRKYPNTPLIQSLIFIFFTTNKSGGIRSTKIKGSI
jgi:hypothetical protein